MKKYTVIIEREVDGYYEGHTENYIKCYIPNNINLCQNDTVVVQIEKIFNDGAVAKMVGY